MKTNFTKLLALCGVILLVVAACKKDQIKTVATAGKPGDLTASASTLVLDKTKVADTSTVISFSFSTADYGFKSVITNTLQIDVNGDNWANPTNVTLPAGILKKGYSTADFNNIILKLSLPGGAAAKVNVRIQHSLSSAVTPIYSNTIALTVTPFNLTSWLYVVGQFNGYNAASPDSIFSATSNGIYTGIINFPAGQNRFLVLPAKNYNNKYATTASPNTADASITYATEYVTGGGSDLYAPAAGGNYLITLNINTNNIVVEPANGYSVIGSTTPGGDFSTDLDLKFVNSTDQDWEGIFPFTAGEFKVRQNHDWTWSWGIPKAGEAGDGVPNTLNDTKNNNIPVAAAGNYKVVFTIPVTAKTVTTPAVTATYSVTKQ